MLKRIVQSLSIVVIAAVCAFAANSGIYKADVVMTNCWDGHKSLGSIEKEHFEIHEGCHYFSSDYDADTDTGGFKKWLFHVSTSSAKDIHLLYNVASTLPGTLQVYEGAVVTSSGTALTSFNNNRTSSNTADGITKYDPVVLSSGTLIFTSVMGSDGTAPQGRGGSTMSRNREIVFDKTKNYLFIFTAAADNVRTSIEFMWYEEE